MLVAGAPLDLNLKARVEEEFGQPLLNNYGITECSPSLTGVRLDAPRKDESVGRFFPGIEHRLVDSRGVTARPGEVGELHVRGPNVMLGYYRAPELTAKAIAAEGLFNTGDLARLDGDHLFIVGRSKELIIRSGFNVYPAEVEAVLNAHELVVGPSLVFLADQIIDGHMDVFEENVIDFVRAIAKFLLGNERISLAGTGSSKRRLENLKRIAHAELASDDSAGVDLAKDVAKIEIDLITLEATEARMISQLSRGKDPGAAASLLKIRGTELHQRLADLTHRAIGQYGLALREHPAGGNVFVPGPQYAHTATEKYLNTRKLSIYGGSNEIQRNIIAKAVLGL
jgi:hypothetical protein